MALSLAQTCLLANSPALWAAQQGAAPASSAPVSPAPAPAPSATTNKAAAEATVAAKPAAEVSDENAFEPVLPKADTRLLHLVLGAAAGVTSPVGGMDSLTNQGALLDWGWTGNLDLGVGVTRGLVLGAFGQYGQFEGGPSCSTCKAKTYFVGPFARYHLVEGLRFDPWLEVGTGFRWTAVTDSTLERTYSGFEWVRLIIGGDYYAFPNLGIGPYIELSVGEFTNRNPATVGTRDTHFYLSTGLRLVFDVPGH